jgi:ketosteroid isomerase-like protein
MKKTIMLSGLVIFSLLFNSCSEAETKETTTAAESPKADMAQVRADIVAIETAWADAMNKKDVNALMAMYADDAVSMQDGSPTLSGKAAIQAQQEKDFAAPPKYASVAFETLDVYGDGNVVTEVGKSMNKDAAGKVVNTGKYIAVFEKRDGKYLCIREIYNSDSKK